MLFLLIIQVDSIHEPYELITGLAIHPRSKETGLSGWFPVTMRFIIKRALSLIIVPISLDQVKAYGYLGGFARIAIASQRRP